MRKQTQRKLEEGLTKLSTASPDALFASAATADSASSPSRRGTTHLSDGQAETSRVDKQGSCCFFSTTLTTKVTIEVSPVKRTRTENTVIAQPPAAATTVTATSTPPKSKQMQAESCIRRQPPKRTAAGVQRADEDVIAHEQKQADEVEPTNLVSDEDDDVDMKDELDLRHEGMSKCEHVRGPHIGEPQRRQLGDDLVEYSKFDVSKQFNGCVACTKRGLRWASNHRSW